jgi:tRNA nucleotidyltransferase (CCA-adding enzyme)
MWWRQQSKIGVTNWRRLTRLHYRFAALLPVVNISQPRTPSGRPLGGSWTAREKSASTVTLDTSNSRTPAPDLIQLTPATEQVLDAIIKSGGRPLIVGGSVRDALIAAQHGEQVDSKDIDIEVYGADGHQQLIDALAPLGHVDERGVTFGVVSAAVDGEDFDISLPRRESSTSAGHQGFTIDVDPNLDERTAFGRRDFTLNALGWDATTGELVDHYGGRQDLEDGILRHTTDAFAEDPLRVLRAMQFVGRFGFTVAPETVELARSIADQYQHLSTERVWGEWKKLALRGADMTGALGVLRDTDWIRHYPALRDTIGNKQDPQWHPEGDVFTHLGFAADQAAKRALDDGLDNTERTTLVLAALLHDVGKPETTDTHIVDGVARITSRGHARTGVPIARRFLSDIGASQTIINKVLPLIDEHMSHASTGAGAPSASAVRALIRRLDNGGTGPTIYEWARLVDADVGGRGSLVKESPSQQWIDIAEHVGPKPRKSLLTGQHIAARGYTPGPGWSAVIAAAVEAQDTGEFDDEAGAVAWMETRNLAPVGYPARPANKTVHATAPNTETSPHIHTLT